MNDKNNIWAQVIATLQTRISQPELKTWFCGAALRSLEGSSALIEVPNKFHAAWLRSEYSDRLREAFHQVTGTSPELVFCHAPVSAPEAVCGPSQASLPAEQPDSLNPDYTFEGFFTGAWNHFAYSCAQSAAMRPGQEYNPIHFFGGPGVGKTHLLHAIGHTARRQYPALATGYVTAARFASELSASRRQRELTDFRVRYRDIDLLLFDDVHLLAERHPSCQHELALLFDFLLQSNRQLVTAATGPPAEIRNILPRLRSRLEWGLVVHLPEVEQEAKMAILAGKAERRNLSLPEDVLFFLANATGDLKVLEAYIARLETHVSLYQAGTDMSTVKSIIRLGTSNGPDVNRIQKTAADYFHIPLADLLSAKKTRRFTYPRQLAMYLSRELSALSYKEIGKAFGGKDHSTIMYAVRQIQKRKEEDVAVLEDIVGLEKLLV